MFKIAPRILFVIIVSTIVIACGGGGGSSATTNIHGNISSVTLRASSLAGINVSLQEDNSFSDVTDDSGAFEIDDIPSGDMVTLVFSNGSESAKLRVATPANATVILQNISINPTTGEATPSHTEVSSNSSVASSDSSEHDSSDDSSDDMSSDDDSSHDDMSSDDSSDEHSSGNSSESSDDSHSSTS